MAIGLVARAGVRPDVAHRRAAAGVAGDRRGRRRQPAQPAGGPDLHSTRCWPDAVRAASRWRLPGMPVLHRRPGGGDPHPGDRAAAANDLAGTGAVTGHRSLARRPSGARHSALAASSCIADLIALPVGSAPLLFVRETGHRIDQTSRACVRAWCTGAAHALGCFPCDHRLHPRLGWRAAVMPAWPPA